MLDANFWQDKSGSTKILKEKKLFENLINSYETSLNKLNDLDDLNKLAIEENNITIQSEIFYNIKELRKIVKKNGGKVIGIMPADTPLADVCDFPLTINIGVNNRISMPLTSRIAYTAVIDVLTMGVAQLKPEAQDHLYNIADSQRSLKIDN